jgi:hypothetical protein
MPICFQNSRVSAAIVCACLSWATNTQAQAASDDATRAVARELGVEGIQAYQANDVTTADQKL